MTHRLAQAARADRIFVLDRGRVVEEGSLHDLLRRGGLYRELWQRQRGFAGSEDGGRAEVKAARLGSVALFAGLADEALAALAGRFETERVPAGRTVFDEGDPAEKLYLVGRGRVEVLRKDADGLPRRVAVLEDGDCFGEIARLEDVPRTAAVATLEPCVFLTLGRAQFEGMLAAMPELSAAFERGSAERRGRAAAVRELGLPA